MSAGSSQGLGWDRVGAVWLPACLSLVGPVCLYPALPVWLGLHLLGIFWILFCPSEGLFPSPASSISPRSGLSTSRPGRGGRKWTWPHVLKTGPLSWSLAPAPAPVDRGAPGHPSVSMLAWTQCLSFKFCLFLLCRGHRQGSRDLKPASTRTTGFSLFDLSLPVLFPLTPPKFKMFGWLVVPPGDKVLT